MRISTSQMYMNSTAAISAKQSDLARLQSQLSSGKRIASLADDPAGAASASVLHSDLSANSQFEANRQVAKEQLSSAESTLGVISENLQSARELLVSAGSGSLSDADRTTIAGQLREHLATLLGLANSSDGQGGYLFGGFRRNSPPFVAAGGTVNYVGDDGARTINVSPTRALAASFSGADIFTRIPSGNGVFVTDTVPANSGTGLIDGGRVTNPAALDGNSYEIRFHGSGSGTTYDVWNTTTNAALSTGTAFTTPAVVALPGIEVGITGAPADGDKFVVAPSANQDIFTTLQKAVDALSTPARGNTTKVGNSLRLALGNLDQGLEKVTDQRSAAGARLNEIDQLATLASQRDVDLKSTLSSLEDTDYVKTISEFTVTQTGLQAALDSYSRIAKTTLFDYIK